MPETPSQQVIEKIKEFDTPRGEAFNDEEKAIIDKMMADVPTEKGKTEVYNYIKEHVTGDAKESLSFLKKDVEGGTGTETNVETSNTETFSGLQEEVGSKNEIMKKLFNISDQYFEHKLQDIGLEGPEKENVKLVLWDKLMQNLDINMAMGTITSKIKSKVQDLFNLSKGREEEDSSKKSNIDRVIQGLTNIEKELSPDADIENITKFPDADKLFVGLNSILDSSIKKIETAKKQEKDLSTIESISIIIDGKETTKSYEDIKKSTLEKLKDIENVQEKGNGLVDLLNSLPKEWQEGIKSFIKDNPVLGFIFGLLIGKDFLKGKEVVDNKAAQSINNLIKLVQETEENNSIKKLNIEELSKLTPEKLKDFFSYLNKNKIDYTTSNFWTEILTGGSKNEQINNVHTLLNSGGDGGVIETTGENITTNFIKKLNNITELEEEAIKANVASTKKRESDLIEEQAKIEARALALATKKKEDGKLSPEEETESTMLEDQKEAKGEEIQKAKEAREKAEEVEKQKELEKQQEQEFIDSVMNIPSLPTKLKYKGEDIELNLKDNNIILGENKYQIKLIKAFFIGSIDGFKGIKEKAGEITIIHKQGKQEVPKEELVEVLKSLLESQEYQAPVPKQDDVTLKIEKIA